MKVTKERSVVIVKDDNDKLLGKFDFATGKMYGKRGTEVVGVPDCFQQVISYHNQHYRAGKPNDTDTMLWNTSTVIQNFRSVESWRADCAERRAKMLSDGEKCVSLGISLSLEIEMYSNRLTEFFNNLNPAFIKSIEEKLGFPIYDCYDRWRFDSVIKSAIADLKYSDTLKCFTTEEGKGIYRDALLTADGAPSSRPAYVTHASTKANLGRTTEEFLKWLKSQIIIAEHDGTVSNYTTDNYGNYNRYNMWATNYLYIKDIMSVNFFYRVYCALAIIESNPAVTLKPVHNIINESLRLNRLEAAILQKEVCTKLKENNGKKALLFEDENYTVVPLLTPQEFYDEASYQHNCVAGYVDRVANHETHVVSIRKKSAPNIPCITCEVGNNGVIWQYLAMNNRNPIETTAWDFKRKYEAHLRGHVGEL